MKDWTQAVLWAALLTTLVVAPWLTSGYLFGTDWPGPRRIDFPTDLASFAPLQAALAETSRIISAEWTGKLLVSGFLYVAALAAYRAAPAAGFLPRAAASTVYVLNPFVYGRLHYGQLYLLAGYAILPWAALRLRRLLVEPTVQHALVAALGFALVGVLSLHLFLLVAFLSASLTITYVIGTKGALSYLRRLGPCILLTVGLTLAASAYWVVPLLKGSGVEGTKVAGITAGDLSAFAAVPDRHLGLMPNLLGLYGFWAENTGRFTSMKDFVPIWPVILAGMLGIAVMGAAWAFMQGRDGLGAWVAGLLIAVALALVLEAGVSASLTSGVVTWLDSTIPVYRGMRDAGKWAALLALAYSQLIALGTAAILSWIRKVRLPRAGNEWLGAVATGLLLALPFYYGNGLLYGMHAEIKPSRYPLGWYQADRVLVADAHPGRALFLPWHEYMTYSFVQNQNNVVASPAPAFFSAPILTSSNPEVPGIAPPADPDQVAVTSLVAAGGKGHWADVLASLDVKYVLLARETDWRSYAYLGQQPGLVLVGDYGSIALYRNDHAP